MLFWRAIIVFFRQAVARALKESMRTHYFQHVPFEGLGSIESWLIAAGHSLSSTRFYEAVELPALDEVDLLIIMGGPMSVNEESKFPWLVQEKAFIRRAITANKSVLGICLGAQLISSAMGAQVYPNAVKEIGWFPVQGNTSSEPSVFTFPDSMDAFHWHGETFDLIPEAIHIASSEGCLHQAFQLGRSVIGLQFHLETTPESARTLIANCKAELIPAQYVQSEATLLSMPPEKYGEINNLMGRLLSFLCTAHGYP